MYKNMILLTIIFTCTLFTSCERDYEPNSIAENAGTNVLGDVKWLKSITIGATTYYVFFSSNKLVEGINSLQASIYSGTMKPVTSLKIEIDPRMPDMENHSSSNNRPLEWNAEKNVYEGRVNLTMTGWWRLHLRVYDTEGNLLGGSDIDEQVSSNLYWDVEI
jgi:hypothetical protein